MAAGIPFTQMILFRIGQGVTAVPDDATAFSHRDARYLFHPITLWQDPADDERLIAATRAFAEAMRPFGTGSAYLNFTAGGGPGARTPSATRSTSAWWRSRTSTTPRTCSGCNQNIEPSRATGEPALA